MARNPRPAWRKVLDQFLADPKGVIEEVKRYVRDVEAGADPIEALHGHICSPECWHQQLRTVSNKNKTVSNKGASILSAWVVSIRVGMQTTRALLVCDVTSAMSARSSKSRSSGLFRIGGLTRRIKPSEESGGSKTHVAAASHRRGAPLATGDRVRVRRAGERAGAKDDSRKKDRAEMTKVLDHGFLELVETWGSDERIIEAARESTDKGFLGWGMRFKCEHCKHEQPGVGECKKCGFGSFTNVNGDEKLLKYLYENAHSTPFEFAGAVIRIQAPIFVFREWHRHRTQCLGPDTLIHFDSPKSRPNRRFVYKMRIEDIWKKWQPTVRSSRPERQVNPLFPRSRIQNMQLRCLNEEEKEIGHTRIVDVVRSNSKPMVLVRTASGRELTATREHKVLTSIGWMCLGDAIKEGALLTLEGTTRQRAMRWERPPIDEQSEKWKSVVGWEKYYEVSTEGRVRRIGKNARPTPAACNEYDSVSLNKPGHQTLRTVHSLVLEAFVGPKPPGHEARHLNDNRADARLSNLAWGTTKENAEDRVNADRQQRLVPVFEEIIDVVSMGNLPTYDLAVADPWHNFVADGFIVHNSYSEISARYTPLPDVNYIPSVERLMINSKTNKQAGTIKGALELTESSAAHFRTLLREQYERAQAIYEKALSEGVPKELARVHLPVGRYSRMRACANLRNWMGFLTLRTAPNAQWEIRQYANALQGILAEKFPRTMALWAEGK